MKGRYRAVFIDMDGTLLRKDHSISSETKRVIQALIQKDILVVIVSARPLHGIVHLVKDIISNSVPVVSLNGSYIYFDNKIIYEKEIGLSFTEEIYNLVIAEDVTPMFYSQMEWYAVKNDERVQKEQRITEVKIIIEPFEKIKEQWTLHNTSPNKILLAGSEASINAIEKILLSKYEGKLHIYKSQPKYLEVISNEASKEIAIKILLKKYGIDRSESIAIGDNYNDEAMIRFAGTGIARGNAPDDIKAIAAYVTDTNNNDGVAKALAYFFDV